MNKKPYEAPVVKKVSLEIQNAVLGLCFSSTVADPSDTCRVAECYLGAPLGG